ncbi:MAG: hypothetical protein P9L89_01560 [Candidatus Celaenobacter polaris]|nr:hypothetical protein [Candidatus Celaenobacter polaris]
MNYKIVFANPSYSKEKIEAIIDKCKDINELQKLINQNLFTFDRLELPCGTLRLEHIQKALNIADYFGTSDVLPDIPLLNKLYYKSHQKGSNKGKVDDADIIRYLRDTFHDLDLSDDDWQRVIEKLSIEEFISIDTISERTVVIWNSLPYISTTNSCTGHRDALRYFCFSNLHFKFDPEHISVSCITDLIKSAFDDFNSNIFKIDIENFDNTLGILFFQIPPSEWIATNNKEPVKTICERCYKQLKTTFKTDNDLDDFELGKSASDARAADYIRKKMYKYFNRLNTNFEIDENEDEFYWGVFRKRCLVFEESYKNFYISHEAIENIKHFWERCEELGKSIKTWYRSSKKN